MPTGWAAAALLAISAAAYANALGNGFVWDDHRVVEAADPGASLRAALTAPDVLWKSDPAAYWRPLTRASFLLDRRLFGLDPLPYHLENVVLHALAAILLFALARRLVGATGPALAAAALFAVHPVMGEAVNLVSGRNTLHAAALLLCSCLLYLRARDERRASLRAAGAAIFFLSLLGKESAFMLLPFLAAHELLRRREPPAGWRTRLAAVAALWPWVAAAAAYVALRALVLPSIVANRPTLGGVRDALGRDLHIVPEYLRLLLLPSGLTIYHAEPHAYFAGPLALVAAWAAILAALALLLRARRPATGFGLLWAVVHFLPFTTLVPIPSAAIAERYLYVPALGLAVLVADQLAWLAAAARRPRAIAWAVVAAAAVLAVATVRRNRDWKDDVALLSSAVRVHPDVPEARFAYSLALVDRGDVEGARREWERIAAVGHTGALSQLGTYWAERGRLDEAASYFARVLAVDPRDVETRFNLGLLLERQRRPREALAQYEAFLALHPVDYPELVPRVEERVRLLRAGLDAAPR